MLATARPSLLAGRRPCGSLAVFSAYRRGIALQYNINGHRGSSRSRRSRLRHPAKGAGGGEEEARVEPIPSLIRISTENGEEGGSGVPSSSEVAERLATEPEGTREDLVTKLEKRIAGLEQNLALAERAADEAGGLREALEAEAQEVAQRAVDAAEARKALQAKLEDAQAAFAELCREETELELLVEKLPVRLSKARATLAKKERIEAERAERERKAEGDAATPTEEVQEPVRAPSPVSPFPDDVYEEWEPKTVEVDAVTAEIADCERQLSETLDKLEIMSQQKAAMEAEIAELEGRLDKANVAASKADEMAAAAMTATENAVRAELAAETKAAEIKDDLAQARALLSKVAVEEVQEVKAEEAEGEATEAVKEEGAEEATPKAEPEEEGAPSGSKLRAKQSSKFMAASFFSGRQGDVEDDFARIFDFLRDHRGVLASLATAVVFAAVAFATRDRWMHLLASHLGSHIGVLRDAISGMPIPDMDGGLRDTLVLLATSTLTVPLMLRVPGGSAVLGFLLGGALIGPNSTGMINNVHATKHIAELGVVFLLFHIGLELSLERLQSMGKLVFGFGSVQVVLSTVVIAAAVTALSGGLVSGPASIIVGASLALSSTAVALQVLQDRGESGAKHGRATFSVLLLQDLAVVIVLMLIPLLAPQPGGGAVPLSSILQALGLAALKAVVCIAAIVAGGRLLVRPLYRAIASTGNAEIFAATTLLMCLGTAELTQMFGLSLALGAFLAGLLLAETEYALQVESDIAPYRGLLLGLFFMTVGMEISPALLVQKWAVLLGGVVALVLGKMAVIVAAAPAFGLSRLAAVRAGLYLGPGGEFAFVALGDAVARNIIGTEISNILFCVTALSMAITPYLAALGGIIVERFESKPDVKSLVPSETETNDLSGHVIICGFGRIGQIIAQVFSERLIPFVALDVRVDRVSAGKQLDLPVYFGDAGSAPVLHAVGAHRASCAVVALDSPGANYRTVYTLAKNFPGVKIFVRARDVDHGLVLEKAGASAVVPETLEPSLQLAGRVLTELAMPADEVAAAMDAFRRQHTRELAAPEDPLLGRMIKKGDGQEGAAGAPAATAAAA